MLNLGIKRSLTIMLLVFIALVVIGNNVLAEEAGGKPIIPTEGLPSFGELVAWIFTWSLNILGIVVFVMIFYSGFQWFTAAGNTAKVSEARGQITNAITGAIILLSAYIILYTINPDLIKGTFTLPGSDNTQDKVNSEISSLNRNSGSVGTEITIQGVGFSPTNNTIKFGNGYIKNLASNADGTSITFTVPEELDLCPPDVDCTVTPTPTPSGTPNPTPTSSTITPDSTPTPSGTPGVGAVQLFMDPDGPGSALPQTGIVQSKFRGNGSNAASWGLIAIIGNTGSILASRMFADLSWNSSSSASSCTLFEEVTFPGLTAGGTAYQSSDYFSPVTFRFPNLPRNITAGNSVKANIPIRYRDANGALVDSPYETKFTVECGGVRSNTITATFSPADVRKSVADFTKSAYGGKIISPDMIKGAVIKADIKAATSNQPIKFSDTSGVPCMNFGGGTALSCNLMLVWSSLNASECNISGLGFSSSYGWGLINAFGYQNSREVYPTELKTLTCRNSTGTSASDSVTVPFP